MNIEYLTWDSNFFNKKIGRLHYFASAENELENLLIEAKKDKYELIYVFYPENIHLTDDILEEYSGKLADEKVVYSMTYSDVSDRDTNSEIHIREYNSQDEILKLENLAYDSGVYSRFRVDTNFAEKDFFNLYKTWLDKSITKQIADKVFVAEKSGDVVGFVTLKHKDTLGEIGLIAVSEKQRGSGIGKLLVEKCKQDLFLNRICQLIVPTQKDNKSACGFYEKCGFKIKSIISIYHFWL